MESNNRLNLVEILTEYEIECVYSPLWGNCGIKEIVPGSDYPILVSFPRGPVLALGIDGGLDNTVDSRHVLYPSEELFQKHPADPAGAWAEWVKAQKEKPWRAGEDEEYWSLSDTFSFSKHTEDCNVFDDARYGCGNYFRTLEQATEAAERIKATLEVYQRELLEGIGDIEDIE